MKKEKTYHLYIIIYLCLFLFGCKEEKSTPKTPNEGAFITGRVSEGTLLPYATITYMSSNSSTEQSVGNSNGEFKTDFIKKDDFHVVICANNGQTELNTIVWEKDDKSAGDINPITTLVLNESNSTSNNCNTASSVSPTAYESKKEEVMSQLFGPGEVSFDKFSKNFREFDHSSPSQGGLILKSMEEAAGGTELYTFAQTEYQRGAQLLLNGNNDQKIDGSTDIKALQFHLKYSANISVLTAAGKYPLKNNSSPMPSFIKLLKGEFDRILASSRQSNDKHQNKILLDGLGQAQSYLLKKSHQNLTVSELIQETDAFLVPSLEVILNDTSAKGKEEGIRSLVKNTGSIGGYYLAHIDLQGLRDSTADTATEDRNTEIDYLTALLTGEVLTHLKNREIQKLWSAVDASTDDIKIDYKNSSPPSTSDRPSLNLTAPDARPPKITSFQLDATPDLTNQVWISLSLKASDEKQITHYAFADYFDYELQGPISKPSPHDSIWKDLSSDASTLINITKLYYLTPPQEATSDAQKRVFAWVKDWEDNISIEKIIDVTVDYESPQILIYDASNDLLPTGKPTITEADTTTDIYFTFNTQPITTIVLEIYPVDPTSDIQFNSLEPRQSLFLEIDPEASTDPWTSDDGKKSVTITIPDDIYADSDREYALGVRVVSVFDPSNDSTGDARFENVADSFSIFNVDNETPKINICSSVDEIETGTCTKPTALTIDEAGDTQATFYVTLGANPIDTIVIDVSSDPPEEGTVNYDQLVFYRDSDLSSDYYTITVDGVDDGYLDGDSSFDVYFKLVSGSGTYTDAVDDSVNIISSQDNETPFIISQKSDSSTTSEDGSNDSIFSVRLGGTPLNDSPVTLNFSSSDNTEGDVSPDSITFTPSDTEDWNYDREITVMGVNDNDIDGSIGFDVTGDANAFCPSGISCSINLSFTNEDEDCQTTADGNLLTNSENFNQEACDYMNSFVLNNNVTWDIGDESTLQGTVIFNSGSILTINKTMKIQGDVTFDGGILNVTQDTVLSGNLNLSNDSTIDIASGSFLSYVGNTWNINNTMSIDNAGTWLGLNPIEINSGGLLDVSGDSESFFINDFTLNGGTFQANGTFSLSGDISLSSASSIHVTSGNTFTVEETLDITADNPLTLTGEGTSETFFEGSFEATSCDNITSNQITITDNNDNCSSP